MADVAQPKISMIVLTGGESRLTEETLYALSARFQRKVLEDDYEVIVVESPSEDSLGAERATAVGGNFRHEVLAPGQSPVELGLGLARASFVGLLLDGTALVSPRLLEHALLARRLSRVFAVVPGYDVQSAADIGSASDGFDLFTTASFDAQTPNGYLCPLGGGSCMFSARSSFEATMAEPSELYAALVGRDDLVPIVLAGEGVFHRMPRSRADHVGVASRQPMLLGAFSGPARRLLQRAARDAIRHQAESSKVGSAIWRSEA